MGDKINHTRCYDCGASIDTSANLGWAEHDRNIKTHNRTTKHLLSYRQRLANEIVIPKQKLSDFDAEHPELFVAYGE